MSVIDELLARYPALAACRDELSRAVALLTATYRNGGKLLVAGNGGSAADAQHIVGELMKAFTVKRPLPTALRARLRERVPADVAAHLLAHLETPLAAISLMSHESLTSAFANDQAADVGVAQQLLGYARPGDLLLAISTSGTSRNIVLAAQLARALDVRLLALTGHSGGDLRSLADVALCVPETETYRVQELHLPIYHALCRAVEAELFGGDRDA